jgi:glycosyltransferase involved in cell wall biosynthesis
MQVSILIGSYGDKGYRELAYTRALPSAEGQGAHEVLIEHFPDGDVNSFRNDLAAKASGDWLCFLDADDELAPRYVEMMKLAWTRRGSPARMLIQPEVWQRVRHRTRRIGFGGPYKPCDLDHGNYLVIGTLIERELFEQLDGFGAWPHGLEDWHLWARAARAGAKVIRAQGAIYIAHLNRNSAHKLLAQNHREYVRWYEQVHADILAS